MTYHLSLPEFLMTTIAPSCTCLTGTDAAGVDTRNA
jgi:hypothetical protein